LISPLSTGDNGVAVSTVNVKLPVLRSVTSRYVVSPALTAGMLSTSLAVS
jgi:hypothetical protein